LRNCAPNKGSKLYYGKERFSTLIGSPGILTMISSPNYPENDSQEFIQLSYPDGTIENVQLPKNRQLIRAEVAISPLPICTEPSFLEMVPFLSGEPVIVEEIKNKFLKFVEEHDFLNNSTYKEYMKDFGRGCSIQNIFYK